PSGRPAKRPRPSWRTVHAFPCTSSRAGPTAPPNTSTIAWCPRQTPSVGVEGASRRTISSVAPASTGRPGPGEITSRDGASRSRLQVCDAVAEDDRADRNTRIQRLARQCVTDCARVRPAPAALQLRDDLHRADLRRAGHGPRRKARAQQVEMGDVVAQLAVDL